MNTCVITMGTGDLALGTRFLNMLTTDEKNGRCLSITVSELSVFREKQFVIPVISQRNV